jgi:hypothetical protein
MNLRMLPALPVVVALCACLGIRPAIAQVEPRSVVVAEDAGRYEETSRARPADGARQYWADIGEGRVRKSLLDGSDAEDVAVSLQLPYGIAFDGDAQALLWTSAGDEVVQKIGIAGGAPVALISEFEEPYAIDVSDESQNAYYYVTGNIVYRDSIDAETGEEVSQALLVIVDDQPVHGLALDPERRTLYIGDQDGRMTRKIDLSTNDSGHLIYSAIEPTPPPGPVDDPTPGPAAPIKDPQPLPIDGNTVVSTLAVPDHP